MSIRWNWPRSDRGGRAPTVPRSKSRALNFRLSIPPETNIWPGRPAAKEIECLYGPAVWSAKTDRHRRHWCLWASGPWPVRLFPVAFFNSELPAPPLLLSRPAGPDSDQRGGRRTHCSFLCVALRLPFLVDRQGATRGRTAPVPLDLSGVRLFHPGVWHYSRGGDRHHMVAGLSACRCIQSGVCRDIGCDSVPVHQDDTCTFPKHIGLPRFPGKSKAETEDEAFNYRGRSKPSTGRR